MSEKLQISARPPKGEYRYKTFSIRIESDIVEELDRLSFDTGRSRNQIIGIMLRFALKNCSISPHDF